MPNETQQPLREQSTRSGADQELVANVLGKEAAAEMGELVDEQAATDQVADTGTLEISKDEQDATNKIERIVRPKIRRHQLIEWAESYISSDSVLGKEYTPEAWIDKIFTINPDGTVDAPGTIDLTLDVVDYLPEGLNKIHGNFHLSGTQLTSLKNLPKIINGDLDITFLKPSCNSIPDGTIVTGKVFLQRKQSELIASARAKGYNVELED